MSGFVVCASCGTQIKAGRAYCLRCGEDLPAEGAPGKFSAWESLELPQHKLLIFLGVVALIVVMLVVVIWRTQPVPEFEVVQPLNLPGALAPVVPAPAAESAAPAESPRPAPRASIDVPRTAVDATRSGVAAYRAGNYDAARAAFEQSVALSPDDAEALNNLGQTLIRLNRVSEAVSRFERAVVLSPNNGPFHFNLAHAMGLLGKWDRAVAEYRDVRAAGSGRLRHAVQFRHRRYTRRATTRRPSPNSSGPSSSRRARPAFTCRWA